MIRPILRYIKDIFTSQKFLAGEEELMGLVAVDSMLQDLARERRVPGLSITALKGGELIFQKGYGYAQINEQVPVLPERTLFRAASISKPIAATAMLKMVEENLLELDASFYDYVPYFPKKEYDFTLRQLAGHTAGIRSYRGKEFALNKAFSIRDGIQLFKNDPLLFKPGTGYHYNSFGWVLLSLAMETVAGIPFAQIVNQKVLIPTGMTNTMPEIQGVEPKHKAMFYTRDKSGFREAVPVNNEYKLAGGGYLSTTADIARLGQAYLDGKVGTPSVVAEFLQSMQVEGKPTYYGLGWEVSADKKGRTYYGHTGNSVGAYSKFQVFPGTDLVLAILVNCTNPGLDTSMEKLTHLLLGDLPGQD